MFENRICGEAMKVIHFTATKTTATSDGVKLALKEDLTPKNADKIVFLFAPAFFGAMAFVSFSMMAFAVPKFAEIHATGTRQDLQTFVTGVIQMMFWPSLLAAAGPAAR